jgi:hypothetical protein
MVILGSYCIDFGGADGPKVEVRALTFTHPHTALDGERHSDIMDTEFTDFHPSAIRHI